MRAGAARRAVVALGLSVAVAGCGEDFVVYRPALLGVTLADSAATGDIIELAVHIPAGGCIQPESIEIESIGPRHLRATVLAKDRVNATCSADVGMAIMRARMFLPGAGRWTVDVVGQDTATLSVAVGAAPARGGVHRFSFESRDGSQGMATHADVRWGNGGPTETVILDSLGRGEIVLPCAGDEERRREISSPGRGLPYRFVARADDCVRPLSSRFFHWESSTTAWRRRSEKGYCFRTRIRERSP